MLTKMQRSAVLITLMLGTFITSMTLSVTNTMLPAIISDLQVTTATAQWLTSGSTLVSGIMIPIAAYLMKRFKSKNYFLFAIAIFCLGSLIGTIAPSFVILLAGRLLQALGCGMLMPFSQVVLMIIYPKESHGSTMGIFAIGSTFAPVVAPSLAGLIVDNLGWQYVFVILFILGVITFIMGLVFMKNVTETFLGRFPLLPVVLSSIGFCGLLIGLSDLSTHSIFNIDTGGALLVGLISLGAFVYMQLKTDNILLNLKVLRFPQFRMAVIMGIFIFVICMGSSMILPIFVQTVLNHTATSYALAALPGAFMLALTTIFSGPIYDRIGPKPIMIMGSVMLGVGCIIGILFYENSALLHVSAVSCFVMGGTGLLNTPATTMGLSNLEGKDRVDASSIYNTLRQISSAIGSAAAIVIFTLISTRQGNEVTGVKGTFISFLICCAAMVCFIIPFLRGHKVKLRPEGVSTPSEP